MSKEAEFKKQYNQLLQRVQKAMDHFDKVGADKIEPDHWKLFLNLIGQMETILMMFPDATAKQVLFGF
jgi:hypothetical protein